MARFQRGWLRVESRKHGPTWVLRFYVTRETDGQRVEHKVAVGLVRDFPTESDAWAQVAQQKQVSCQDEAVCGMWGLHEWRKTFACRLHRSGVDARTIQHLLGHSDLETTLRYLRSASQETKDHGQKLEAAFGGQRRAKGVAASKS